MKSIRVFKKLPPRCEVVKQKECYKGYNYAIFDENSKFLGFSKTKKDARKEGLKGLNKIYRELVETFPEYGEDWYKCHYYRGLYSK